MRSPTYLLAFVFLTGCGDGLVTTTTTAPPPHQGATVLPAPTSTPLYPLALGATTGVRPGVQVGYGVTALAPNTYRIVWTGDSNVTGVGYREFSGSIWTAGHFTAIVPGCGAGACPLEDGDYVSQVIPIAQGERVDWDTFASVGFDGFDVTTDGGELYVDVFVDGLRHAELVYLPVATKDGQVTSPTSAPFGVVAQ